MGYPFISHRCSGDRLFELSFWGNLARQQDDMVYGNKTYIGINSVTGDNHSLNKLNFVALDSIDVDYVPSIKNVREASEDLYAEKSIENSES